MTTLFSIMLLLVMPALPAYAEPVYKTVDEEGKVTYTQTPPEPGETAFEITIDAPPSRQRAEQARQRHERNEEAARILEQNRKRRDQITAEENRLKRARQGPPLQQDKKEGKEDNDRQVYPYYYPRIPQQPPLQPGPRPPVHLPVR